MIGRWAQLAKRHPERALAATLAWSTMLSMVVAVVGPWFQDITSYGFHDWDVETSFRYLVKLSLLDHGEFPGYNPYACGGYPSWGYVEGSTNLVSPWLPVYLVAPMPLAIRIETAGMGLLGIVGSYAWASRFSKSQAARLLVVALWALNGRWALQAAAGHTWHLAYAYLPWCGFFFERAVARRRMGDRLGLALAFALQLYAGGIYPLPHTVLVIGGYALCLAAARRDLRPLAVVALSGLVALGLAAPKLLPLLDTFATDPRLIASREQLSLGAFVTLLTSRDQAFTSRPAAVSPYGWHEWGMYISWAGLALVGWALLFVRGRREAALKLVGIAFVLLGFGAFHPLAPWRLLHDHAPVFRSQHVPSRFLYPAVLLLSLVAASGLGRWLDRRRHSRPWLDVVATVIVCLLAMDVASVARKPMEQAMWMRVPDIPAGQFHQERQPPFHYLRRDWAAPMLLSMMANTGVVECYGVPRSAGLRSPVRPRGASDYRGEVFVAGEGSAERSGWSPNAVEVSLQGVGSDALLVVNMRHFSGWRAEVDGRAAEVRRHDGLIAVALPAGASRVRFHYRPPGLWLGCGLCALTLAAVGWALSRERRTRDVA